MFFYVPLNFGYEKLKAMGWEGEGRVTNLQAFFPLHCSGPSGFHKRRSRTFQSHFRAYKVNTYCKLFIFANKGEFFLPKGHLYP